MIKNLLILFTLSALLVNCGEKKSSPNQQVNGKEQSTDKTRTKESNLLVNKRLSTDLTPLEVPQELISNKDRAIAFIEAMEAENGRVYRNTMHDDFVQHDVTIADGKAGLKEFFQNNDVKVEVYRAGQQGNFAFTHSFYNWNGVPKVGIDVFRFEKGKVIEHWNSLADIQDNNGSDHSQIDGVTEGSDEKKTGLYLKTVGNFVDEVLIRGNYGKMDSYVSSKTYTEHSPYSKDGIEAYANQQDSRDKSGKSLSYEESVNVIGEGNFVVSMCKGTENGKPVAIFDLFRLHDNRIVEHWEAISAIPPASQHKNANGKF